MRLRWAAAMMSAAVVAATAIGGTAALATPPVTLGSGYVLDDADVLSPTEESEAQSRLEQLKSDTGLDLWVVYVDQFTDPSDRVDWANQTAEDNGLGTTQYLLAISTEGRQYYLSGDSSGPLTGDQLDAIEQQRIQPALAQDDWLGAVDAAADGMADAHGGGSGAAASGGGAGAGCCGPAPIGTGSRAPVEMSTTVNCGTADAAGCTTNSRSGSSPSQPSPVRSGLGVSTGADNGVPRAHRTFGVPRSSTSTTVPDSSTDCTGTTLPLRYSCAVTRVSARNSTGVSLRMYSRASVTFRTPSQASIFAGSCSRVSTSSRRSHSSRSRLPP